MPHRLKSLFALVALSIGLVTMVSPAARANGPQVSAAFARATSPTATVGAAFFTLTSPIDDRLVSATSPAAARVELHTHVIDGGIARMRQVDGIDLPAGMAVDLKPGGMHVMLMGLKQPLTEGGTLTLTLTFAKSTPLHVTVPIGRAGQGAPTPAQDNHSHH